MSLWDYLDRLPVEESLSLGEPTTPLVSFGDVLLKLEGALPTGSFKDRGAAVQVAALRERGITHVVEDSSGNAGAALAAYCARAGIRCDIYVPSSAPETKLDAIRAYGANLIPVDGPRANATLAAEAADAHYASHAHDPMYLEGTKTFAFELYDQLGGAPDAVVFPVGGGALLLGAHKGFQELGVSPKLDRRAGRSLRAARLRQHPDAAAECRRWNRHRGPAEEKRDPRGRERRRRERG